MKQPYNNISLKTKVNFYLNLVNSLPFIILLFSGLMIQVNYHMHRLPDDYFVLGLTKHTWLLAHRISAAIAITGCIFHCVLHWKYIKAATRKFFIWKSGVKIFSSYYLTIIGILTTVPVLLSWIFLNYSDHLRSILVEIHDKLAILFMIIAFVHLISRTGWMLRTYRKIRSVV